MKLFSVLTITCLSNAICSSFIFCLLLELLASFSFELTYTLQIPIFLSLGHKVIKVKEESS